MVAPKGADFFRAVYADVAHRHFPILKPRCVPLLATALGAVEFKAPVAFHLAAIRCEQFLEEAFVLSVLQVQVTPLALSDRQFLKVFFLGGGLVLSGRDRHDFLLPDGPRRKIHLLVAAVTWRRLLVVALRALRSRHAKQFFNT